MADRSRLPCSESEEAGEVLEQGGKEGAVGG